MCGKAGQPKTIIYESKMFFMKGTFGEKVILIE